LPVRATSRPSTPLARVVSGFYQAANAAYDWFPALT